MDTSIAIASMAAGFEAPLLASAKLRDHAELSQPASGLRTAGKPNRPSDTALLFRTEQPNRSCCLYEEKRCRSIEAR